MKTAIIGAGALGRLLGAYTARGGGDVTLLDLRRPEKKPEVKELEVRTLSGESFRQGVRYAYRLEDAGNLDLLIVCVKTFQTEDALKPLAAQKDRVKAVVSFQNGVEKDRVLEAFFGAKKVFGGCCLEAAMPVDESAVMHTMSVVTYLGERDGRSSDRVRSAVKLIADGGLKAEAREDVVSADWCKWINFAAASAACGLTRLPYYKVLLNPHSANLVGQIYREYAGLAGASGVAVKDYPGFEVKTIAAAPAEDAVKTLEQRGQGLLQKGAVKVMPSLAQAICAGRRTEFESIFGFAVREGEKKKLHMPLTQHVYAVFRAIDESLE